MIISTNLENHGEGAMSLSLKPVNACQPDSSLEWSHKIRLGHLLFILWDIIVKMMTSFCGISLLL
jgi:hypothetical protein